MFSLSRQYRMLAIFRRLQTKNDETEQSVKEENLCCELLMLAATVTLRSITPAND